jgi:hypothetical protein
MWATPHFTKLDFDYFDLSYQDQELRIYSGVVNCPFLKRDIRLAYTQYLDENGFPTHYKLYFSTDLTLPAWMLVKYYRLRYQQEFLTARAAPSGWQTVYRFERLSGPLCQ